MSNVTKHQTIMVVDDDDLIRSFLSTILADLGVVELAASGNEALEKVEDIKPDLIILDVQMPKMDGYEVCRHLKANEQTSDIPVVFITSNDSQEDEEHGFDIGATDFIRKPISSKIVRARVAKILERRTATRQVAEKEKQLCMVLENMPGSVTVVDQELNIVLVNDMYKQFFGDPDGLAVAGAPIQALFESELDRGLLLGEGTRKEIIGERLASYGEGIDLSFEDKSLDGRTLNVRRKHLSNGHTVTVTVDVTELKEAEEEVIKLSRAVEQSPSIVMITDLDGTIEYVNPKFTEVTGYQAKEAIGQNPRILQYGDRTEEDYAEMWRSILSGKEWHGEFRNKRKDGSPVWISAYISPILGDDGKINRFVAVQEDITKRKETEDALHVSEQLLQKQVVELKYSEDRLEAQAIDLIALAEDLEAAKQKMQHMANHDALTGLPSLRLCRDRLESAMAHDRRNKAQTAVLFIDLDGFKSVNDSMGHKAGDEVLKGVAERLKSSIREADTAARIGGDEFILVLPEAEDKDAIAKIAQKIIDIISEPFSVDGGIARIGASIGIAFSPADGATPEELLRNADESMYVIKKQGKNNYGFFA